VKIRYVEDNLLSHNTMNMQIKPTSRWEKWEIVVYQPHGSLQLEVIVEHETVRLSQDQIASLFWIQRPAITKHLRSIYQSWELDREDTCSKMEHMGNDGKQQYITFVYNLDMILSVGYRVNSPNATRFRRWANEILKAYIIKGYAINQRFENLEQRVAQTEEKIDFFVQTSLPPVAGIFCDGQVFDAYVFVMDLIKSAKKRLILIDNYVDETVLTMFSQRGKGVSAMIYTESISQALQLALRKQAVQYSEIEVKTYKKAHDRFLIVDREVYHIGASLKDLWKRMFAFSKIEIDVEYLLEKLGEKIRMKKTLDSRF